MTDESPVDDASVSMDEVRDILTRLLAMGTIVIPDVFLGPLTEFLMGGELFNPYLVDPTGRPWKKCSRPDGKKWPSSDMTHAYMHLILHSAFNKAWKDTRRHINDFNHFYGKTF